MTKPVEMITSWVKWMNQAQKVLSASAMDLASSQPNSRAGQAKISVK
jgi:hypothetical protein